MISSRLRNAIMIGALFLGSCLILWAITAKSSVSHDESISYLAAAVNQGQFEWMNTGAQTPVKSWVPAKVWKQYFQPSAPLAFRQIGIDLAETDIHPPLYFWLLHIWVLFLGIQLWTGPTLNLVLYVISGLCLFGLAAAVLTNKLEQAVVVFVWALSPAVIGPTLWARQYTLFGLVVMLFVWVLVRWSAEQRPWTWLSWVALTLVTVVAGLTHYHFVIYAAAGCLLFLGPLVRKDKRRVITAVSAMFSGTILFVLLHPTFYRSIFSLAQRQTLEVTQLVTVTNILSRIYAIGSTFTSFWVVGGIFQVLLFCVAVSLIVWLFLVLLRNPKKLKEKWKRVDKTGFSILWFLLIIVGITLFLYLGFFTPGNGMAPRHMSAIWPFWAFLPVFLTRFVSPKMQKQFLMVTCAVVLLSGVFYTRQQVRASAEIEQTLAQLEQAPMIISDSTHRGIFPRLFFYLPDDLLIFAGNQEQLIADPENWLDTLEDGTYFISDDYYDNSIAGQEKILSLLSEHYTVEVVPGHWQTNQKVYIIKKSD